MSLSQRIIYRLRQFQRAVFGPWPPVSDETLAAHLSPELTALFRGMSLAEQSHGRAVLCALQKESHSDPDLLSAALLHDVGKSLAPLSVAERVLIVVAKRFIPYQAARWGHGEMRAWKRPFVVALQHPAWGGQMIANAGAPARTCDLVRRHQENLGAEDALLSALQKADGGE